MSGIDDAKRQPTDPGQRGELDDLIVTLRRSAPSGTRRDFLRWSAISAGAVATVRAGSVAAAPSHRLVLPAEYHADQIEKNVTINVPLDPYGQSMTLDPHRTVNWGTFWALFPNVWGGLVRFDENAKVQLDLAESYAVNTDGTIYTFKIRPDAKYANGKKVVAGDFVTSWKRALDPSRLSPMASFMGQVKGYAKYTEKKSKSIGFKAVDDSTVEITLTKPYSFFLSYLAAFVWSVVDPKVLKDKGDDGFALADAGTGPWRFTSFDPATQVVMEPNTNHYGGNSPSIVKIVWPFVTGPSAASTALNLYKQDQAISADVPFSLKAAVEGDTDLSKQLVKVAPAGSTRSIAMDFNQAPFNDVRVRRAVALGADRAAWANDRFEGTWTPTKNFLPPIVTQNSKYQPPDGIEFNADDAKKSLADAGFAAGKGLPPVTYYEPSEDTDDEKARWKTFIASLSTSTGIPITHDATKTVDQISQMQTDNGGRQFDVVWWWNITETPHLLGEVMSSKSGYMKGVFNWSPTVP
ncbi:MAG: ABC transporter substrate-binding protein, partial [Thermomicrobiales bacterium]